MTRIIHIVAKDGRYFVDEYDEAMTDEEVVQDLLEKCCIPLKGIYVNACNHGPIQPIWEAKE